MLGVPHAGQAELLQRFICGYVDDPGSADGHHKNVLEHLTGHKQANASIGKRHKTMIQCNGREREMLLRTAVGDPGPQVLKWADAFLVVFQGGDEASARGEHDYFVYRLCPLHARTTLHNTLANTVGTLVLSRTHTVTAHAQMHSCFQ